MSATAFRWLMIFSKNDASLCVGFASLNTIATSCLRSLRSDIGALSLTFSYSGQYSSACSSVSIGISLKGRSSYAATVSSSAEQQALQYLLLLAVPLDLPVSICSEWADMRILAMLRA